MKLLFVALVVAQVFADLQIQAEMLIEAMENADFDESNISISGDNKDGSQCNMKMSEAVIMHEKNSNAVNANMLRENLENLRDLEEKHLILPEDLPCEHFVPLKAFMEIQAKYDMPEVSKPLSPACIQNFVSIECLGEEQLDWYVKHLYHEDRNVEIKNLYNFIDTTNRFSHPAMKIAFGRVASFIHGKSADELKESFGLKNGFSDEEKEAIAHLNTWVAKEEL